MTRKLLSLTLAAVLAALAFAADGDDAELEVPPKPTDEQVAAFRELCARKAKEAALARTITAPGLNDWLFLRQELRHISVGPFWGERAAEVSQATRPEYADPTEAIVDFHEQLDELGITLYLVPVPPKAAVYADKLDESLAGEPGPPRLDVAHQEFYELLRDKGVTVLDLFPHLWRARAQDGEEGPIYCRTDAHWSGRACVLAAERLAERITAQDWYAGADKGAYRTQTRKIRIDGDLRRQMAGEKVPRERLPLRFVGVGDGMEPVLPDESAPVLLLADSHGLVFHSGSDMHTRGAGLTDQLAAELGFPVDLLAVKGSAATPARISLYRRSASNPDYLNGKKVVIWCFAARELTESTGWRPLPVRKD